MASDVSCREHEVGPDYDFPHERTAIFTGGARESTMPELKSTGWFKYSATNITSDDGAPTEVATTLPSTFVDCHGFRAARLRFYVNADAATMTDITVFLVYRSTDAVATSPSGGVVVQYHTKQLLILAAGTMTGGTTTGVAGGNATTGENYMDEIGNLTVSTWGQKVMNHVNGTIDIHSGATNEIGELLISDLANADYLHIVFDLNSATLVNAEVRLDT